MEKKNLIIIIGSVIATFLFLVGAYTMTSKPQETFFAEVAKPNKTDHSKWSKDNKIVLVEYSDFQCPACQLYEQMISALEEDPEAKNVMEKVTLVYRNFPLDQIHPNAREAAYAAEAAGKQDKFFPMHDLLFENQTAWSEQPDPTQVFEGYAKELNLSLDQYKKDYDSSAVREKVQADFLSGTNADVQGTPTFFLNGSKIQNPRSPEELIDILTKALEK